MDWLIVIVLFRSTKPVANQTAIYVEEKEFLLKVHLIYGLVSPDFRIASEHRADRYVLFSWGDIS